MNDLLTITIAVVPAILSGVGVWALQNIKESSANQKIKYDIFISYPMKGIENENERSRIANMVNSTKNEIEKKFPDTKVFTSINDDNPIGRGVTLESISFKAIKSSRYFILIYPNSIASSVLLETGCALGLEKNCLLFCKSELDLPYLIRVQTPLPNNIHIIHYDDTYNMPEFICSILSNLKSMHNKIRK